MKNINKITVFILLSVSLTTQLLTGCSHEELPTATSFNSIMPQNTQSNTEMTQILDKLTAIQQRINMLEQGSTTSPVSQSETATQSTTVTVEKQQTQPSTPTEPAAASKAKPVMDKTIQGRQLLDKVMNNISGIPGFDSLVNKYEVGLQSGEKSDVQIRMIGKNPHRIKIEVTRHPEKKGLKVAYTGGNDKIDIRPNGILSLISTNKKMNDPIVLSKNGHEPDDMDFYSLAERFANPSYQAELAGKTTLNGQPVYILKITSPANTLNPSISHEYIGFDPQTYNLRIWEAYSDKYQGGQQAFIRTVVESYKPLTDVPEQLLKI